jgi:hypothetical protein
MPKNENLVTQRNGWLKNFENGAKPKNLALLDYRQFRNSESWRVHSSTEEVFEYILYLEKKLENCNES